MLVKPWSLSCMLGGRRQQRREGAPILFTRLWRCCNGVDESLEAVAKLEPIRGGATLPYYLRCAWFHDANIPSNKVAKRGEQIWLARSNKENYKETLPPHALRLASYPNTFLTSFYPLVRSGKICQRNQTHPLDSVRQDSRFRLYSAQLQIVVAPYYNTWRC